MYLASTELPVGAAQQNTYCTVVSLTSVKISRLGIRLAENTVKFHEQIKHDSLMRYTLYGDTAKALKHVSERTKLVSKSLYLANASFDPEPLQGTVPISTSMAWVVVLNFRRAFPRKSYARSRRLIVGPYRCEQEPREG